MKLSLMKVLIDAGHGRETPGKRSPDGRILEYKYCREIAKEIVDGLNVRGVSAMLLTPEERDVSLSVRAARANAIARAEGAANVILVSVHLNAAGSGSQWMNARGWEAWTSPGNTKADLIAESLYAAACRRLPSIIPIRTDFTDGDSDKEGRFAILTKTICPAVITENLFQDNLRDVEYLLSAPGRRAIIDLHIEGIVAALPQKCKV